MSDNKTTELLREGLTERGIEWRSGLDGVTFVGDWCLVEYDNGRLAATCEPVLTPEQAIAATLSVLHDNPYVGLVRGKQWERHEMSDYYCGRCGWKVTDHDSYCPECGGAFHKTPNKPDSQFDARKTAETTENATSKCNIRDFDDTREKLEAEIFKCDEDAQKYSFGAVFLDTRKILGWLDRQAAITEREWREKCASDECCDFQELVDANAELQGKVDGLEAERGRANAVWPRFEDGAPVRFGDIGLDVFGHPRKVGGVRFYPSGGVYITDDSGNAWWGNDTGPSEDTDIDPDKRVKRPPILAKDGKPIEVGETLYGESDGIPWTVDRIDYGKHYPVMAHYGTKERGLNPEWLTHEQPRTVEGILQELEGLRGNGSMYEDVVTRAAELAGELREKLAGEGA